MRPRVLVSHPGRQHGHQLVHALQEGGYLEKFITSIWYKPHDFPYRFINLLPPRFKKFLEYNLNRRYYENIDGNLVEQFPFFEIPREALERVLKGYKSNLGIYLENQIHDWYTAGQIDRIKPNIVVGYESSALRTFKRAKSLNLVTVLDLAQVHYKFLIEVKRRYVEYDKTFDKTLTNKVNSVKEEELKYAEYIITLSNLVKASLIKYGISEDKIYLANLGFDPETFSLKKSYRKDGTFKILYVGAITQKKGIRLLLEAYKHLNLKNSELTLIGRIANDGDFLKEFKGVYKYIPYLDHKRLVSYYQDSDIFVFPSYLDSWGMVVIEAMACGTPIIVSENTGAKEVVINGVNGFIIPVEDVVALEEKILFFYKNRSELEHFGKNARMQAENYTWGNYRRRVREIMLQIWNDANTSGKNRLTDSTNGFGQYQS